MRLWGEGSGFTVTAKRGRTVKRSRSRGRVLLKEQTT